MMTNGDAALALAEKLLGILDRGSFTSTYKYAVLLGLIDLALAKTSRDGSAPTSVTTRELAERVTALYWAHTRPFPTTARALGQNRPQRDKGGQAEIVRMVEKFQTLHPEISSAHRARLAHPREWETLIDVVEWKLIEMPLPRLQVVGGTRVEFLYAIGWTEKIRRSDTRSAGFDNLIRFLPGVAECLVRLSSLLRPLIQREWSTTLARFNELPSAQLEDFLFGARRESLELLRQPLLELQRGACFYCRRRADPTGIHIDHFLPWARHANDAIENLVAAHDGCNLAKSDHLASAVHLERWLRRGADDGHHLAEVARGIVWPSDGEATLGAVRGLYLRLPDQTPLWRQGRVFDRSSHADIVGLMAA
jgi:hypothetical protein